MPGVPIENVKSSMKRISIPKERADRKSSLAEMYQKKHSEKHSVVPVMTSEISSCH